MVLDKDFPIGVPRFECTCIGDVEKAEMLDAFYLAKKKHEEIIAHHKEVSEFIDDVAKEAFLKPLVISHERAIKRIEVLENAIEKLSTCD